MVTALIAIILAAGRTLSRGAPRARILRQCLWEWNAAWLGLGLALALTFFFTEGLKDLIGKPRPDLLSRCDLDPATVAQFALGGEGTQLPLYNVLISSTACRQTDSSKLDDGFASFPSGHSSCKWEQNNYELKLTFILVSWTGMFYLTLFICSKWSVAIPYLLPFSFSSASFTRDSTADDVSDQSKTDDVRSQGSPPVPLHRQAAAPPAWLFIIPLALISTATYVSSTRFSDFRHHGFDIIFGSLMGITSSSFSFRMYHLPIRRSAGWSWGPRSASKAFCFSMDGSYVEKGYKTEDLEAGRNSRNVPLANPNPRA